MNISRESHLMTDAASWYRGVGREFTTHDWVDHSAKEYGRREFVLKPGGYDVRYITTNTNTVEGYYSIFKRGMKGVYQHCSEKHLHRYLSEFDFRYNTRIALGVDDAARADKALEGIRGKRLKYRRSSAAQN